jgi:hypothetical protein
MQVVPSVTTVHEDVLVVEVQASQEFAGFLVPFA